MGNLSTIDSYCGKDPNFTVIHDKDKPDKHFDGCGFTQEKCTREACCSNIKAGIANGTPMTLAEIQTCFVRNMKSKGQC